MDDSRDLFTEENWDAAHDPPPHMSAPSDDLIFEAAVNNLPEGWYFVDARGVILNANPALGKLLAAHEALPETLQRRPLSVFLSNEDVPRLAAAFRDAYHTRTPIPSLHVWTKGRLLPSDAGSTDNLRRCLDFSISPVIDAEDRIIGYSGIVRDVTAIAARIHEYEALEKVRAQFVRIITHDLRNPLTLAIGYLDFLAETLGATRGTDQSLYLEQIRRAHQRIQEITSDGLTLEQTYATQRPPANRVLLDLLTRKAMIDFRAQALNSSKQMFFPFDPAVGDVIVLGEESILYRAIANLVSNALKFSFAGARITLRLTVQRDQQEARAVFSVDDTGFGIPEADQHRLFSAFARVQTPETQNIDGAGLGLYITKRIIEWHGGTVFFRSTYGQGSTFGFELPCVSDDTRPARTTT